MAAKELYDYLDNATADKAVTLSIHPSVPPVVNIPEKVKNRAIVREMDDGTEDIVGFTTKKTAEISLEWKSLSASDAGTVMDYYCDSSKGGCGLYSIKYDHYDGHTYVVRFMDDLEREHMFAGDAYKMNPIRLKVLGKAYWDLLDDDCSSLTGWTDGDAVNGESTQTTYDGRSCFKLDSGTATSGTYARRYRDVGSLDNYTTVEYAVNHAALGTRGGSDYCQLQLSNGTIWMSVAFATNGLFIDNVSWNEVGTDLVQTATWQTWRFVIDWTAQTVDVYLNNVLQQAGVDCGVPGGTDGLLYLTQRGTTTNNRISYIDSIKVAHGAFTTD